jgi:hypothetical protein
MNNYLQNDRHKTTTYIEELSTLRIDDRGAYTERDKPMYTECIQNVYTGKDSIDKDSIDKLSIEKKEKGFKKPTFEEVKAYCEERNNGLDAEGFINFYESKGWMIGKNKMKDWKAAIRTWEKRNGKQEKQGGWNDVKV